MTLAEVTAGVERSRPGVLTLAEKISLISTLDRVIFTEIYQRHSNSPLSSFEGYTLNTPVDTLLLAPEAYGEIYVRRLEAECDYRCAEIERYNGSRELFNSLWDSLCTYWRREHRPLGVRRWKISV